MLDIDELDVDEDDLDNDGPDIAELLVEQTRKAERLELLLLANKCRDLEEFCKLLEERINASK